MQRIFPGALAITAIFAMACSEGPTAASAAAGSYDLVSVNGMPLPYTYPVSVGFSGGVYHGDLVLRGNRTFRLGIGGWAGGMASGTFNVAGDELTLTLPSSEPGGSGTEFSGEIAGDSVVVDLGLSPTPFRYVFRRAQRERITAASGTYTLTAVNGNGEPLMTRDTVIGGDRHSTRVLFDTLVFVDDVFYRQHRAEESVLELADGTHLLSGQATDAYGSYDGAPGKVVLRPYLPLATGRWSDTLAIVNESLVRTTTFTDRTLEEKYERRR